MSNRQIVYPGAIPLETDLLNTNMFDMIGLAKLAAVLMGGSTYVHGLSCTPSSPASMVVNVAPGQIYSLQNIDDTAFSSLPADTAHSILKQGYVLDAQAFTLVAPTTAGYSVNYLIQVAYSDVDGGQTVLPYYNASNPSTAWSGPNNSGMPQSTVRQGVCTVSIKSGVAATTGTQTTPTPDIGKTALYVITVAQGATSVTAANITSATGAPFLPAGGLVDGIQRNLMTYATDTGTANVYVAQYFPAVLSITDGTQLGFKAKTANTGASTFNPNGLGASPVLTLGGTVLLGGEIPAGSQVVLKWNSTLSSWLIVSASGNTIAPTLAYLGLTGPTIPNATGRLINIRTITSTQVYTETAGTKFIIVTLLGGGGGGAGAPAAVAGSAAVGGSGGAGSFAKAKITTGFSGATVTIGAGGAGGTTSSPYAAVGGTTSFGALVTAAGGDPGRPAGPSNAFPFTTQAAVVSSGATGANIVGTSGAGSMSSAALSASAFISSPGASSQLGAGGFITANNSAGITAAGYGAGGGPTIVTGGNPAVAGGAGSPGICIIQEFA